MMLAIYDYDATSVEQVHNEMIALSIMEGLANRSMRYTVERTSPGHYRAIVRISMTFAEAIALGRKLSCDQNYLDFCEKLGQFTRRVTAKASGEPAPVEVG